MARIRSIHPGFFTDEHLVSVSFAARILVLGLWVEADDKGVFEWKPIQLKMKVLPNDNVDIPALLTELESVNAVRKYEVEGRSFGAIRNFRKYQRPKQPNSIHPITPEIEVYVHLIPPNGEMDGDEQALIPRKGEKSPQMEDGGWRRLDGEEDGDIQPPESLVPAAFAAFTDLATEINLPKPQRLTEPRKRALTSRLKECGGLNGWQVALGKIRGSPFLKGQNKTGWKADFDFVLQQKSFTKLMEGAYDERSPAKQRKSSHELLHEAVHRDGVQGDEEIG